MKPCCSLLSRYPLQDTTDRIFKLAEDTSEITVAKGKKGTLRVSFLSLEGGLQKPLLGNPKWDLVIKPSELGTLVELQWVFPLALWLGISAFAQVPGVLMVIFGSKLLLTGCIFGIIVPLLILWSAWSTRRGLQFKRLKALLRDTLDAL